MAGHLNKIKGMLSTGEGMLTTEHITQWGKLKDQLTKRQKRNH